MLRSFDRRRCGKDHRGRERQPEKPAAEPPKEIYEDDEKFIAMLTEGDGKAIPEMRDKYSGKYCLRVTPDQRLNPALPMLESVRKRSRAVAPAQPGLRLDFHAFHCATVMMVRNPMCDAPLSRAFGLRALTR